MNGKISMTKAKLPAEILTAGAVSGLFYGSALFAFVFLIPVQIVYGRWGKKAGLLASAFSLAVALLCQLARGLMQVQKSEWAGLFTGTGILALLVPPCLFLVLLALMNLKFWDSKPVFVRSLSVSIVAALLLIPALVSLEADASFRTYIEGGLSNVSESFKGLVAEGYDASALNAMLNPKEMLDTTYQVLNSCYAALILAFMAGSWWLGQRMAQNGSGPQKAEMPQTDAAPAAQQSETGIGGQAVSGMEAGAQTGMQSSLGLAKPLEEIKLPEFFIWPFIVSWAAVLGLIYLKAGDLYEALAWNTALVVTCAYTVQGLGLFSYFLRRWNTPRWAKICLAVGLVMAVATPPYGTMCAFIFPILGVTEIWIPYRKLKGVGA